MGEGLLVLDGATLINGTGTDPRRDSVIVVDDDRILRVGSTGDFHYPDSARLGIDALLHSGAEGPTWELVPEGTGPS